MLLLLVTLIFYLIVADAFALDLSLAPGLSVKNAILYVTALLVIFRAVLDRGARLHLPGIHFAFGILIGYAILTSLAAALIIEYPRYDLLDAAIRLKSTWVDQFIFFLVFFHALRTPAEAMTTLKAMLLAVVFANLLTVVNVLGILDLGVIQEREDGRVQGALGESNQYAAFISLFLPALFAAAAAAKGAGRAVWGVAILVSAAALVMTVSRGAFVGLVGSGLVGVILLRHLLSARRVAAWTAVALLTATVVVLMLSLQYGALLEERLFHQTGSVDLVEVSSGRTEIWMTALERMVESPLTLISGFGWDVYWTMPFRFSPHNHYLALWFNLGLPGLLCGVALLVMAVGAARDAAGRTEAPQRLFHMAFVFGTLAFGICAFFVDLYRPWLFFWGYAAIVLRLGVFVLEAPAQVRGRRPAESYPQPEEEGLRVVDNFPPGAPVPGSSAPGSLQGARVDRFGWVVR